MILSVNERTSRQPLVVCGAEDVHLHFQKVGVQAFDLAARPLVWNVLEVEVHSVCVFFRLRLRNEERLDLFVDEQAVVLDHEAEEQRAVVELRHKHDPRRAKS